VLVCAGGHPLVGGPYGELGQRACLAQRRGVPGDRSAAGRAPLSGRAGGRDQPDARVVVRGEAGVDLAEERRGGLVAPVEVAPPAVAAQRVREVPPDALLESNLTHRRWFARRTNLPCRAHRMTGGSIGVCGRTEAPRPAISDAGALGDQRAVARCLP